MGTTDPNKKEHLGRTLMRFSLVLSCGQVLLLFTILGLAFFTPTTFATPDYLKAAYVLGEAACVFVAIPSAIASLAISTERKARAALVLAIGVAIFCGFFILSRLTRMGGLKARDIIAWAAGPGTAPPSICGLKARANQARGST